MAEEPTSVQGLNSADALQRGIGLRLDRRFAGVNSQISVGVGLLMTVLSVGGYALWSEFHGLKADFARARGDTDVIKEQAADQRARLTRLDEKLEKNLAEIVRSIRQAGIPTASPVSTTTPERTSPFVAMTLSDEESEIIRKFFGVKKRTMPSGLRRRWERSRRTQHPFIRCRACFTRRSPSLRTTGSSRMRLKARSSSSGRWIIGSSP